MARLLWASSDIDLKGSCIAGASSAVQGRSTWSCIARGHATRAASLFVPSRYGIAPCRRTPYPRHAIRSSGLAALKPEEEEAMDERTASPPGGPKKNNGNVGASEMAQEAERDL